ncbi:hypothetical protein MMB17_07340 [Methylobacterium organophilum]|uniref:hypothetical protein n=1 Tax=Methylobacterium organophilum TaxID=410 RepID=UPI001F147EBD|nr:hypothetical protein [Methylobacterium organophilum]UMY19103.1 hypothetical protein MMB17_07340 [Methylobacterium organophilum]
MTEYENLPKRVRSVIEHCRSGKTLCRGYKPRAIGDDVDVLTFWFEPGGLSAPPASSRRAISEGYLVPADSGLLGDGNAQSFIAAPGMG